MIPESIKVLAEDIHTTDYAMINDCAVTRALRRANIAGRDGVGVITADNSLRNLGKFVEADYLLLQGMYKFVNSYGWEDHIVAVEPRDFDLRIISYERNDNNL